MKFLIIFLIPLASCTIIEKHNSECFHCVVEWVPYNVEPATPNDNARICRAMQDRFRVGTLFTSKSGLFCKIPFYGQTVDVYDDFQILQINGQEIRRLLEGNIDNSLDNTNKCNKNKPIKILFAEKIQKLEDKCKAKCIVSWQPVKTYNDEIIRICRANDRTGEVLTDVRSIQYCKIPVVNKSKNVYSNFQVLNINDIEITVNKSGEVESNTKKSKLCHNF